MYENFNASSSKSLDSIFTRLQKIVSQLAILSENIAQEDLNFKFLRSLPFEWSMHVVVWRNKPDLGTISFDDLYNNFKIVEQEVKRSATSSSNSSSQNVAFVSTPGSTIEENTANVQVNTASTPISIASTNNSIASLSDATVYAFLANQPNGSQLRTGKKVIINGNDTASYDKSKVECFNCHKMGYFARECRGPRNQDSRHRNQESSKRTVNVEDTSSKAMVAFDGAGFDWSFMTDEEVPTNLALMAFSDSEVYNHKTCSDTCLKSYETLKSQYDNLRVELNKFEFDLANYKRCLASVEEQLVFYKKNKGMLNDQIAVLKRDASFNESKINVLKIQIERLKKEKECLFAPPTIDLSNSGLKEFKQPEFEGYRVKVSKSVSENSSNEINKTSDALIIEDWVSDCDEDETMEKVSESTNVQKPKQDDQPRKGDPQVALKDTRIFYSGCSKHMTGNKSYLTDYQDYYGGFIAFAGSSKGGRITGKGKIRTGKLDFEDAYFVKELKFNLFSVSQMCDKKNSVLFTETECLILSPDFKLPDENQVMLKIPRKDNMYSFDLNNIVPSKGLTCLIAKATNDESNMWHRRLGHINFKTMNKLVKGKLVRENQLNHKVKIIRCDNGTEFKNYEMNQFCGIKGIKREFSIARTPQQNGVAERKNMTLIEAARTMVLVTKPHNKTPYELLIGRTPIISFMRPFGCPVTILNTLDHLGKFDGKVDEGFLVGYSINSKAFRVFNSRTRKVEENLHVNFLENKPNVAGSGPEWLFDIDTLTNSMNYQPVSAGNRTNGNASLETNSDAGQAGKENVLDQEYILLPLLHTTSNVPSNSEKDESSPKDDAGKKNAVKDPAKEGEMKSPWEATNNDSSFNANYLFDPLIPDFEDTVNLQDTGIFGHAYDDEDVDAEADINNLETTMSVSPIPTTRIHKDHPKAQIIGEVHSVVQTRRMAKQHKTGLMTFINKQRRTNHKDFQNCLFACFLSQMEQKKVTQALDDDSWKAIGTKWVFKNKKDQRGIVVRNKARLVAQGYRQEEGVDYDEVFAPVARIEAIRLFLAFASYMDFTVYQMDVKSAFLYGTIEEEIYVCQPLGFVDPEFPNRVYKVEKALYGLHQALRAWYETLSTYLLENGFRKGTIDKTLFIKKIKNDILLVQVYVDDIIFRSTKKSLSTEFEQLMHKRFQMSFMGELTFFLGLQVEQRKDGIFLSQDKYVYDILKKFGFSSVKTASTPMETHKALTKDAEGTDVDVHLYRSMIGSLMYLTSSRPDIMFAVCACLRFQVQPKASHMDAVKRIFRYLKAYSDSDYAGASLDRKSTTGGCQFLGCRLISWQCKKQIIMPNSTTKAEYIAASNCYGQVLWLQNQLLDYGYNFMKTKIHVDNKSAICVVKNHVSHSKTKHIEIRYHFIRDSYEKKLIEMVKIHIDYNVADLLTKAFDVTRFQFFIASIEFKMANLRYSDKHNMVAFQKKPTESVGFTQIVDFLKGTSLRYALTHNLTIYDSLVKQFWQTATVRTLANGIQQLGSWRSREARKIAGSLG
ncbi:putative ribonuclease H-like domain-containing protein [Tanacetum coccineum]